MLRCLLRYVVAVLVSAILTQTIQAQATEYIVAPNPGDPLRTVRPGTSGSGAPSNPCPATGATYIDIVGLQLYSCPAANGDWFLTGSGATGPVGSSVASPTINAGATSYTFTHNLGTTAYILWCVDQVTNQQITGVSFPQPLGANSEVLGFGSGLANNTVCYASSGGGLPLVVGTAAQITGTNCTTGQMGMATDATPGLNLYFCTATNTWTQQAATNTVGGNQTATSYSTNGANTGTLTVTAKTSGAMSVITAPDALSTGGTLYVPVGSGTLAIGGSGAGGGQVNCSASTATANTTTYSGFSTCLPSTSKTTHAWYVTTTCTLQNFWLATLTTQPSDGALVATLIDLGTSPTLLGNTSTTLTVTVAASATFESLSDTTHTYQATAGHFLVLQLANASMSASAQILGWGVTCQ
jgi:hypothetical protein